MLLKYPQFASEEKFISMTSDILNRIERENEKIEDFLASTKCQIGTDQPGVLMST